MEQFLCLKASAGSGKTFALTVRYISLLLQDVHVTSILTLTFTNKAALEMSQRIYTTLKDLGQDDSIMQAISQNTNLSIQDILGKKEQILEDFISNELSIYTIDKFVNKILREFSGYIDISDDFSISNDDQDLMLYKFLNSLDFKNFDLLINFSHTYNKKLHTIVSLFKTIDEKNENIQHKNFDSTLIDILKTDILNDAEVIKDYVLKSSLSNRAMSAVEFIDIASLLKKGATWLEKDCLEEYSYFKKDKQINTLNENFLRIKENLKSYFKLEEQDILNKLFEVFNNFKKFRRSYKKDKNTFEFRDITNLVYELLEKHIEKDFLYFRLDVRYNHILIDEFQDTSVLQYKILQPLIQELLSGSSEHYKTFFYVGDTKQSIYRFRGGNKELFDYVIENNKILKLEILDTNYRSSQNVVSFVNDVFLNVPNYEYYSQKVNSKILGYVEVTPFNNNEEDKYFDVKNKLEELIILGVNTKNIAILTYTNKDVLELYDYLSKEFKDLKIITEVTSKLINQNNIKASINFIKYLYFKEDIYKANFNALIGKNPNEKIETQYNLLSNSLEYILKEIAIKYEFFDENFLKFLEIIQQYNDIVDFVYEIHNDDTSMINKESSGLQILTVFKSKGLEFDTVLLLDRISKKKADTSSLLFSYDKITLESIYYKNKARINFDENYKEAINNEEKLSLGDEQNILYVALTRAKNNMIIFKKEKSSVFDALQQTITYRKIGNIHIKEITQKPNNKPINIQYESISLGVQEVAIQNKEEQYSIKERYFGIATHYVLEMMKNFDEKSLKFALQLAVSRYNNYLNKDDFLEIFTRIKHLITSIAFKQMYSNATYFKEQSLIYKEELKIIDLLIKKQDKYIIIDYKTTAQKSDSHIKQVDYYKSAIQKIFQEESENVIGYIVYLNLSNVEFIKV
jgi:exodeoxyribonuclease V beta subunit